MENHRKLIKFGTSSYVISLPSRWITKNKLSKGSNLVVNESLNNELILSIGSTEKSEYKKEIVIELKGKEATQLKREIISCYINNYNLVKIDGENIHKFKKEIQDVLRTLMGFEIVEENSRGIVLRDFIDLGEVSYEEIFRKIDVIIKSMMEDIKLLPKKDISENIASRDDQVNKLVYLLMRNMRFTLECPHLANEKNQMNVKYILNAWDTLLNIERVADGIKRISRKMGRIRKDAKTFSDMLRIFTEIESFYKETLKTYYTCDVKSAYNLSLNKRRLADVCNKHHEKYWGVKQVPIILESFKDVISSIHNILRRVYS
ncbi:MAG TPA: phosphate uptake regulator PhoU [Candidatus Nanoarchaeia archaeon]|nr:phosphate uptake regulator PhoU [Candidatus Nanoarchaeia archaeon]